MHASSDLLESWCSRIEKPLHENQNRFTLSNIYYKIIISEQPCCSIAKKMRYSNTGRDSVEHNNTRQSYLGTARSPDCRCSFHTLEPKTYGRQTLQLWANTHTHTLDIVQLLAFYIMFTIYLFNSTYNSFFHFIFISFRFSAFKILAAIRWLVSILPSSVAGIVVFILIYVCYVWIGCV